MTTEQRAALDDSGRWLDQARRLLARLGFALVEGDRERSRGEPDHLLLALRATPTLEHFDPEEVTYWVTEGGRGRPARLDRDARLPIDSRYAWGRITITDRLGVANQFLSFGGRLRGEAVDDGTAMFDFDSVSPILRWSGHSQGLDPLTAEVGAFFGRMKVRIDFVHGIEGRVASAAPRALYCAFVLDVRERLGKARSLRDANRALALWASHEAQRMETDAADDWKAGQELWRELGLGDRTARE